MFKFIKKVRKLAKLKRNFEEMELKTQIMEKKAQLEGKKTKKTKNKWDKINEDYEGMHQFAEKIADDYDKGGIQKLLENPQVIELLKTLIPRLIQQNAKQGNSDTTKGGKGLDLAALAAKLPPEVQQQAINALTKNERS